jgi:hypothetical protein
MIVAEERRTLPSYLQVGIAKFRFTIKSPLTTSLGLLVLLLRMVWGGEFSLSFHQYPRGQEAQCLFIVQHMAFIDTSEVKWPHYCQCSHEWEACFVTAYGDEIKFPLVVPTDFTGQRAHYCLARMKLGLL